MTDPGEGSQRPDHGALSTETVVPAAYFDALMEDLDEKGEIVPALARAAVRSRKESQ